jgi:hypothetical protein
MTDICMGTLMGFDIQQIALLKAAELSIIHDNISLNLNGQEATLNEITNLSIQTLPPPGWVDCIGKP